MESYASRLRSARWLFSGFVLSCSVLLSTFVSDRLLAQTTTSIAEFPHDRLKSPRWAAHHLEVLDAVKKTPDAEMILLGDSITDNYNKSAPADENFQPIWKQYYEPRKALNLGFSGDTTSNLLWRIRNGEIDGLHPKVAMLLIGTNNTDGAHQGAEETERGIDAVVLELRTKLPDTHILLLGILPSGVSEEKTLTDQSVNAYLAKTYAHDKHVTFLDVGYIFLKDGKLDESLFYDPRLKTPRKPLHPDAVAQRRMAEAIEPTLRTLLHEKR